MKKIYVIGPQFFGYAEDISNELSKNGYYVKSCFYKYRYGFLDTLKFGVERIFANKKFVPSKKSLQMLMNKIKKEITGFCPDYILVINGELFTEKFYDELNGKKILWMFDLVSRFPECERFFNAFDFLFFYDKSDAVTYKNKGYNAAFLPDFVNTNTFYEVDTKKIYDVTFVGAMYENRYRALKKVVDEFPNLRMKFYGQYIGKFDLWKRIRYYLTGEYKYFTNTNISANKVNELNNKSKIVLNIQHEKCRYSVNMRFFEVAVCGVYQIVNSNQYLENEFSKFCGIYKSETELIDLIRTYFYNEGQCNDAAKKLSSIVRKEHTIENRVRTMIAELETSHANK